VGIGNNTQSGLMPIEVPQRVSIGFRKQKGEPDMPFIQVVTTLIVVGVLLWLVNRFIPMQSSIPSTQ
jgi:hypothetical protein